jgi:tetratricopeptide (TPR) repeat protein
MVLMIMMKFKNFKFLMVLVIMNITMTSAQANEAAADLYANSKWAAAIKAYKEVIKEQPNNEQAWYRTAQAHINLKQGKKALKAIEHLVAAKQIPASAILYQKAQAYHLRDKKKAMWNSLDEAVESGFRNVKDLETNPLWDKYRNQDQFSAIKLKIDRSINPCMHDDKYRAFDFWLGEWEVYGNLEKTGPMYGHNSITRTEQGCLIKEVWAGSGGSTGTSMNYYDGIIDQWVQRWVSGGGTVIDYSGGLIQVENDKQAMRLDGKIYYASTKQQPQIRDFRGTWTALDDGVVQQFFEESIDGGKTWNVWFDGYYFPINTEMKNAK